MVSSSKKIRYFALSSKNRLKQDIYKSKIQKKAGEKQEKTTKHKRPAYKSEKKSCPASNQQNIYTYIQISEIDPLQQNLTQKETLTKTQDLYKGKKINKNKPSTTRI